MQKREINYLCFSLVFCLVCFPSPLMYFIGLDKAVASGLLFILLFLVGLCFTSRHSIYFDLLLFFIWKLGISATLKTSRHKYVIVWTPNIFEFWNFLLFDKKGEDKNRGMVVFCIWLIAWFSSHFILHIVFLGGD